MSGTKKRLAFGEGAIDQLPSGRYRVRVRLPTGKRVPLGVYDTFAEANGVRVATMQRVADGQVMDSDAPTLLAYGERWLDQRELADIRNIQTDRGRWRRHIASAHFANLPMVSIRRREVREWVLALSRKPSANRKPGERAKRLNRGTVKHTLTLLRGCLQQAVDDEYIASNPARDIAVPVGEHRTEDAWTYLSPDEQKAILTCAEIPVPDRLLIAFALGTGMREGEVWNLELRDLHVEGDTPHVFVRYGSFRRGKPQAPKNGRTRTVPLFGAALAAATAWVPMLRAFAPENPAKLVFPTPGGTRRQRSKYEPKIEGVRRWPALLALAGITRHVRFHDLRHSCASSLVAGWWGRTWRLEEVKELLGHGSVKVTEKYAHLGTSSIAAVAKATGNGGGDGSDGSGSNLGHQVPQLPEMTQDTVELSRRRPRVRVPSAPPAENKGRARSETVARDPSVTQVAEALLRAASTGKGEVYELADRLARAVLDEQPARLALAILENSGPVLAQAIELAELVLPATSKDAKAGAS